MANIKSFYDYEVAMIEHQFIKENDVLEVESKRMMWYLAGIHDFAEKMIELIHEKEGF